MKKVLLIAFVLICTTINAQEKITIKETFENNRLKWEEYYEKEFSGTIEDGYYVLENKKADTAIYAIANLPIIVEKNFKITVKLLVPQLNDKYYFGIIYNFKNSNNCSKFKLTEGKFKIIDKENGNESLNYQTQIILKSGKNKEVLVEIIKKGTKITFNVDDMEVYQDVGKIEYSKFGFFVEGKNTIKVDEITIEQ